MGNLCKGHIIHPGNMLSCNLNQSARVFNVLLGGDWKMKRSHLVKYLASTWLHYFLFFCCCADIWTSKFPKHPSRGRCDFYRNNLCVICCLRRFAYGVKWKWDSTDGESCISADLCVQHLTWKESVCGWKMNEEVNISLWKNCSVWGYQLQRHGPNRVTMMMGCKMMGGSL